MLYNKFAVKPSPFPLLGMDKSLVYIGVGSGNKNGSLAENWNGGKPFNAVWYRDGLGITRGLAYGEDMHAHYFVEETAPILSVIYPPDETWLEKAYYALLEENAELKRQIEDLNDYSDTRDRDY